MSRARRTWVIVILVLATFLGFLSILARWADQQALDTDQWVDTSTQLLENKEVRDTLAAYLVDELYTNVDVATELQQRLPPELRALAGPAAAGLRDASYAVGAGRSSLPGCKRSGRRPTAGPISDSSRSSRTKAQRTSRPQEATSRSTYEGCSSRWPNRSASAGSGSRAFRGLRPARGHELG